MRSVNTNNGSGNRHYMAIHTQPPHSITTLPNGCRTPVAWQNRENFFRPSSVHPNNQLQLHYTHRRSGRPSSPSVTTTSSDDREEVPMVRHQQRRQNSRMTGNGGNQTVDRRSLYSQPNCAQYHGTMIPGEYAIQCPNARGFRTGTLRSTKSVPALAMATGTWDGEPCPVHGSGLLMTQCHPCFSQMSAPPPFTLRRFGSAMDVRAACNEKKYSGGLMPVYCSATPVPSPISPLPPQSIPLQYLLPPPKFHHPRPLVYPAYSEPLPVRDPFKVVSPVPSNQTKYGTNSDDFNDDICCKGHLVVLWIILGVVTIGVISGIILAVTMN